MFRLTKYWIVDFIIYAAITCILIYILRRVFGATGNNGYTIPKDANARSIGEKQSLGETITRKCLEATFNRPFSSVRPEWLKNPKTGKCLEIDCFNSDLKLGVEFDGQQHAQFTPQFHKTYADFKKQQYRDTMKDMLCKENGYTLIRIPHTVPFHKIEGFLLKELAKAKIQEKLPFDVDSISSGASLVQSMSGIFKK